MTQGVSTSVEKLQVSLISRYLKWLTVLSEMMFILTLLNAVYAVEQILGLLLIHKCDTQIYAYGDFWLRISIEFMVALKQSSSVSSALVLKKEGTSNDFHTHKNADCGSSKFWTWMLFIWLTLKNS